MLILFFILINCTDSQAKELLKKCLGNRRKTEMSYSSNTPFLPSPSPPFSPVWQMAVAHGWPSFAPLKVCSQTSKVSVKAEGQVRHCECTKRLAHLTDISSSDKSVLTRKSESASAVQLFSGQPKSIPLVTSSFVPTLTLSQTLLQCFTHFYACHIKISLSVNVRGMTSSSQKGPCHEHSGVACTPSSHC